jgi:hypothetical protein
LPVRGWTGAKEHARDDPDYPSYSFIDRRIAVMAVFGRLGLLSGGGIGLILIIVIVLVLVGRI